MSDLTPPVPVILTLSVDLNGAMQCHYIISHEQAVETLRSLANDIEEKHIDVDEDLRNPAPFEPVAPERVVERLSRLLRGKKGTES